MMREMNNVIPIFCCCTPQDESYLNQLKRQLVPLQRQRLIEVWSDRDISAGTNKNQEIVKQLHRAKIILLLMSPDFIASEYRYNPEISNALKQNQQGSARVIPIILHASSWEQVFFGSVPFSRLQVLPTNAQPITHWKNEDDAWHDVGEGIKKVVLELQDKDIKPIISRENSNTIQRDKGIKKVILELQDKDIKPIISRGNSNTIQHDKEIKKVAPELQNRDVESFAQPQSYLNRRAFLRVGGITTLGLAVLLVGGAFVVTRSGISPSLVQNFYSPSAIQGNTIATYLNHSDRVETVTWSSDGKFIASGSDDNTIQVWNATNGNKEKTYSCPETVEAVAWSPDGKLIASGSDDGIVRVWDWDAAGTQPINSHNPDKGVAYAVAWSPDSTRIAIGYGDKIDNVQVWNIHNNEAYTYRGHSDSVQAVTWSPDGKFIASGSNDNTVQVWAVTQSGALPIQLFRGHTDFVRSVAWSPDGKLIASGSDDGTVQVWNVATAKTITPPFTGHKNIHAVAWFPNSKRKLIASGGNDGTVQVWNPYNSKQEPYYKYNGHVDNNHGGVEVFTLAWSPEGQRIASGGNDKTVRVWDAL